MRDQVEHLAFVLPSSEADHCAGFVNTLRRGGLRWGLAATAGEKGAAVVAGAGFDLGAYVRCGELALSDELF
jgi:uncharacterized protein with von Willebrand factor type A (vWA) domain